MNQILDRSIAPQAKELSNPKLILPESVSLQNSVALHFLSAGTQELVKIEVLYKIGDTAHTHPLVSGMTFGLLKEGSKRYSAAQIADWVDNYGAFLEIEPGRNYSSIHLYSLNRFLPDVLPLLSEIIHDAVFPADEFEISKNNKKQKFLVGLEKVGFLASKRFQELLFGETGYGTPVHVSHYDELKRESLIEFYHTHLQGNTFEVFVSGLITKEIKELIELTFSGFNVTSRQPALSNLSSPMIGGKHFIEKQQAMQNAIRIGRPLFSRNHPDYFEMKVLLTILGGYFGSRLMSNIREDKGYTYGIGAGLAVLKDTGYFYISTEVGSGVYKEALTEIYKEIELLQHQPVSEQELNLVKNYMLGSLLKSFEGPFECMERFKTIHLDGFNQSYYDDYAASIRNVSAEKLQHLAQKWLKKEDLIELVVGAI